MEMMTVHLANRAGYSKGHKKEASNDKNLGSTQCKVAASLPWSNFLPTIFRFSVVRFY